MKTSKTETLKECLTNPDIVDYINTEKNFSICRPYHNKNIDFLEKNNPAISGRAKFWRREYGLFILYSSK